jgi:hypothetical protein
MTIDTRDDLVNALANNNSRFIIDKSTSGSTTAGIFKSYWRETGQPGQGAIPTAVATCNNTTLGSIGFAQQTAPATSYVGLSEYALGIAGQTLELHDRLAHMGGLSGTVTTVQTVNLDMNALLGTDNISARKGDSNYSDVTWWLEWYTATGTTGVNFTVNVTYDNGTTGNLTALAPGASVAAGRMYPLNSLIPAADSGKFIRGVNSMTLSATTGTAGNFGVTATRYRVGGFAPLANARFTLDWAQTGLAEIYNASCLFPVLLPSASSNTTIRATGKIIHG